VDLALELIKLMIDSHEEDLIHIFVESKPTLLSLFEMLNADTTVEASSEQIGEIRKVVATILGSLAESGLLTTSVEKFGVKSSAISALAAACLADDTVHDDDDDQLATSATMSSRCMACLVELCTVETKKGKKTMQLAQQESDAIARSLGRKICQMVISRFIERAKLRQYDVEEEDDVMDAPDVKMLCAIAQHSSALKVIASIGGLHALSLIAAEGELSAILALKKACEEDPSILIDVDGHVAVMKLISEDEPVSWPSEEARRTIETAVFELLSDLCSKSKGKRAVVAAEQYSDCIAHAAHVVSSLVDKIPAGPPPPFSMIPSMEKQTNEDDEEEEEEDGAVDEDEDVPPDAEDSEEEQIAEPEAASSLWTYKAKPQGSSLVLESAALSFLGKLVGIEKCRLQLFSETDFMPSLKALSKDSTSFKLQMQTTTFLANIAPFAKRAEEDGTLTTADIADALTAVIKLPPQKGSAAGAGAGAGAGSDSENLNSLKTVAAKGLGIVLNDTKKELQVRAMEAVTGAWSALVKRHTIARTAVSIREKAHSALLAYNLSCLMVRSTGNAALLPCLTGAEVIKSMIHLIEWRYDTKTTIKGDDEVYWNAAVSNSIQELSYIVCSIEEAHAAQGVSIKAMMGTVLMLARPGKAPRKTADFPTTLQRIVDTKMDAGSVLAAGRILDRIID